MIKSGDYFEYQGCIHIHTTASDGTKSIEEVAEIAAAVKLDYILIADHMTLKARDEGREGYYGETLVLIGYEHNDPDDCNHYLIFESKKVFPAEMTPKEYVAAGAGEGALGIIAHPDEIRPMTGKYRSYPWTDWEVDGFVGIEIWNQMSEWMENLNSYNKLKMLFSPRKFLRSPTDRILNKWDELNREKKIIGVAAIDVHAFPYRLGPIKIVIFPYKVQFKSLRTHLLLPRKLSRDTVEAKRQIYDAILNCRAFVSNYRWGDAAGFEFTASSGDRTVVCGGSIALFKDCLINIRIPKKSRVVLICNGEKILEKRTTFIEYKPQYGGLYRVEVYRHGRGWIYSNHIRIGI
nr:histidinol-phosphatase [candidate division Zixibacteria bacterium]